MDVEEFWLGYGAPWLDLLATRRMRRRPPEVEYLTDTAALRRWLRREGLDPAEAPNERDLESARRLREALYLIARATLDETRPPAEAIATVNAALGCDDALRLATAPDGVHASRPRDTPTALARLAREAAGQLTGPAVERLRPCAEETCGGIFLDESGRRRWCSDSRCGSRARVRAHRERARHQ